MTLVEWETINHHGRKLVQGKFTVQLDRSERGQLWSGRAGVESYRVLMNPDTLPSAYRETWSPMCRKEAEPSGPILLC
ncbi:hypothetical protein E2C01_000012 [Portunus trituberculatus]|uniref:Uncharacterized protein n=1 Tax=Portunus trituberculatus TaxID=210409 RepID=A0A5B7CD22_PORTR|nr:hypothetical protein [Portunus trituberculatus]